MRFNCSGSGELCVALPNPRLRIIDLLVSDDRLGRRGSAVRWSVTRAIEQIGLSLSHGLARDWAISSTR